MVKLPSVSIGVLRNPANYLALEAGKQCVVGDTKVPMPSEAGGHLSVVGDEILVYPATSYDPGSKLSLTPVFRTDLPPTVTEVYYE